MKEKRCKEMVIFGFRPPRRGGIENVRVMQICGIDPYRLHECILPWFQPTVYWRTFAEVILDSTRRRVEDCLVTLEALERLINFDLHG